MSTQTAKPIRLGGVLYAADTPERNALLDFAKSLLKRGWDVRGLTQERAYDKSGEKIGLDAIDIQTGRHYPLARPSKEDRAAGTCGFDVGLLYEASSVLRSAIEENADLLIVEKFGEREQDGNGLAEEILNAAISGIPTLVAVPADALETWNAFSGRLGTLLPHDGDALRDWWPKWNLYRDLTQAIGEIPVKRIVIGANTILVEGPNGCGVSTNPLGQVQPYPDRAHTTLADLCAHINDTASPLDHALAVAATLAHYNTYDKQGSTKSGLDHFNGCNENILVVGTFPQDRDYGSNPTLIGTDKALAHLLEYAYDGLILPSHTFGDATLPTFLQTKGYAQTVLVGPETPLCETLFDYGLNVLSGRIICDADEAARIVQNGGTPKDLKPASRYITLEK